MRKHISVILLLLDVPSLSSQPQPSKLRIVCCFFHSLHASRPTPNSSPPFLTDLLLQYHADRSRSLRIRPRNHEESGADAAGAVCGGHQAPHATARGRLHGQTRSLRISHFLVRVAHATGAGRRHRTNAVRDFGGVQPGAGHSPQHGGGRAPRRRFRALTASLLGTRPNTSKNMIKKFLNHNINFFTRTYPLIHILRTPPLSSYRRVDSSRSATFGLSLYRWCPSPCSPWSFPSGINIHTCCLL